MPLDPEAQFQQSLDTLVSQITGIGETRRYERRRGEDISRRETERAGDIQREQSRFERQVGLGREAEERQVGRAEKIREQNIAFGESGDIRNRADAAQQQGEALAREQLYKTLEIDDIILKSGLVSPSLLEKMYALNLAGDKTGKLTSEMFKQQGIDVTPDLKLRIDARNAKVLTFQQLVVAAGQGARNAYLSSKSTKVRVAGLPPEYQAEFAPEEIVIPASALDEPEPEPDLEAAVQGPQQPAPPGSLQAIIEQREAPLRGGFEGITPREQDLRADLLARVSGTAAGPGATVKVPLTSGETFRSLVGMKGGRRATTFAPSDPEFLRLQAERAAEQRKIQQREQYVSDVRAERDLRDASNPANQQYWRQGGGLILTREELARFDAGSPDEKTALTLTSIQRQREAVDVPHAFGQRQAAKLLLGAGAGFQAYSEAVPGTIIKAGQALAYGEPKQALRAPFEQLERAIQVPYQQLVTGLAPESAQAEALRDVELPSLAEQLVQRGTSPYLAGVAEGVQYGTDPGVLERLLVGGFRGTRAALPSVRRAAKVAGEKVASKIPGLKPKPPVVTPPSAPIIPEDLELAAPSVEPPIVIAEPLVEAVKKPVAKAPEAARKARGRQVATVAPSPPARQTVVTDPEALRGQIWDTFYQMSGDESLRPALNTLVNNAGDDPNALRAILADMTGV